MPDAGSWRTKLAESFKTGNIAEDLNYTYHGSSCQILQRKLANHRSAVTAVAHERAITRYKSSLLFFRQQQLLPFVLSRRLTLRAALLLTLG